MKPASVGFQCPSCVKEGAATVRQAQAVYGGRAVSEPRVTQGLLGLNVLMFLLTTLTGTGVLLGGTPSGVFTDLALLPTRVLVPQDGTSTVVDGVAQGEYWRLVTAMFLHFGIIHIALNMLCLFQLGPALEASLGRARFLAVYLLSGLSGSALSYTTGPANQLAAGASGAVFGLFAAYFVVQRSRGGDVSGIAVTIGINLFISFSATFIDWRGHVGGLIGGALLTAAIVHAPRGPQRTLLQAGAGAGLLGVIAVAVLVRTAALT